MTDIEREEETLLERLVAIRELRQATHRLKSEDGDLQTSTVTLPAGWLPMLERELAMAIEDAEEERVEGKLDGEEYRKRVDRAHALTKTIRRVQPGSACAVDLSHHESLLEGLRHMLNAHFIDARYRLSERDPLGPRFIASHSLHALGRFIVAIEERTEADGEPEPD
jgi:hypothetical protein